MVRILRALALVVSGCTLLAACSLRSPLPDSLGPTTTSTTIPEGLSATADDADTETSISFDDYSAALDALSTCMVDSGAALSGRILDPITGLYLYDYDPAFEQIHVECYDLHFATIDQSYRNAPRDIAATFDDLGPAGDLTDVEEGSWIRLLATAPDIPETRFNPITVVDIARTREAYDIALPSSAASDQTVIDYQAELSTRAGLLPIGPLAAFGRLVTPTEMRLEVGFDMRSWDQVIALGSADREHLAVAGRFDPARINTAVSNDPVWNDLLTTVQYDGVAIHEWGSDGGLDLDRTTPVRTIGAYQRLALVDGLVLWNRFTRPIEDAIDAIRGARRSLADVPELRRLAQFADEQQHLSASITMRITPYVGYADNGRIEDVLLDQPLALMYADGVDTEGAHMAVALMYASADQAEANLIDFEHRIAEAASTTVTDDAFVSLEQSRPYEVEQVDDLLVARIWKNRDRLPPPLTIIRFN